MTSHYVLVGVIFVCAVFVIAGAAIIDAPYGRHSRGGWGPSIPDRIGWVVMESPSSLVFATVFLLGAQRSNVVSILLGGMWLFHYVYRTFIYPFRKRTRAGSTIPIAIVVMGLAFNMLNSVVNAGWISEIGPPRDTAWLVDPRFLAGALLFFGGIGINRQSDGILKRLRETSDGYAIPHGGLYRWISCPNYLGEMIQWIGWAIATWSWAGAAFAAFTVANLGPRALSHHQWYRETFEEYPSERKAVLPGIL